MSTILDTRPLPFMPPPAPTGVFMVDIETVGVRPGSAILELAAAEFVPDTGEILREWSAAIDLLDSAAAGMTIDPETARWHLRHAYAGTLRGEPLFRVLNALDVFLHITTEEITVWAWGIDFERSMIEAACEAARLPLPWKYWQSRCARTVWDMAFPKTRRSAPAHRAAEDVRAQISDLAAAIRTLK